MKKNKIINFLILESSKLIWLHDSDYKIMKKKKKILNKYLILLKNFQKVVTINQWSVYLQRTLMFMKKN